MMEKWLHGLSVSLGFPRIAICVSATALPRATLSFEGGSGSNVVAGEQSLCGGCKER